MYPPNREKIAFITPHGTYCYNVMPFGVKNFRVTYQIMVTKIFYPLLDWTVEAYIDNMVVKSRTQSNHSKDLEEAFKLL